MSADAEPASPLTVFMLADHLDAALAAGEDLIARGGEWRTAYEAGGSDACAVAHDQRRIAEGVRAVELALVARVLKAREHARELGAQDPNFAQVANLFAAGTSALLDAVEECGDARARDFETGDDLTGYLRGRGLIAPSAARIAGPDDVTIDEGFMVARKIALGPLLDMAASFLDALEARYDIFADEDEPGEDGEKPSQNKDGRSEDRRDRISLN